jgi:hypothetical protein
METINIESFIQCHTKPFQPRNLKHQPLKFSSIDSPPFKPTTNIYNASLNSKNRSSSVHEHEQNNSKSNVSLKLPSIYKNNLKYFLKEAAVKEMKKQNYTYKVNSMKNPASAYVL